MEKAIKLLELEYYQYRGRLVDEIDSLITVIQEDNMTQEDIVEVLTEIKKIVEEKK